MPFDFTHANSSKKAKRKAVFELFCIKNVKSNSVTHLKLHFKGTSTNLDKIVNTHQEIYNLLDKCLLIVCLSFI